MKNIVVGLLLCFSLFIGNKTLMAQSYEQGFAQRRDKIINRVADNYTPPGLGWPNTEVEDPEKYVWPKVIARMYKYGATDSLSNVWINQFKTHWSFHFIFVGTVRILGQFPTAPMVVSSKNEYLNRIWNRYDSYNAFTGEGTENHLHMNRTSGYLAAQYSLGNTSFPLASSRLTEMSQWVDYYVHRLYEVGSGEWNSSVYGMFNLHGWLNLYDFAQDAKVKNLAHAALDYYATEIALFYNNGTLSGPELRGTDMNSMRSTTSILGYLWFGDEPIELQYNGNSYIFSVFAAVSNYRPSPQIVALAHKKIQPKISFKLSRPGYLLENPSETKIEYFADKYYTVGTAYTPYLGFSGASYGVTNWKMVSRVDYGSNNPGGAQFMLGNGGYLGDYGGGKRQPFDQFAQYKNVVIQLSRTPNNALTIENVIFPMINTWKNNWSSSYYQRFSGSYKPNPVGAVGSGNKSQSISFLRFSRADTVFEDGIYFIKFKKTYAAIRTLNRYRPADAQFNSSNGSVAVFDYAPIDSLAGFVVEFKPFDDFSSFDSFKAQVKATTSLTKVGKKVTYTNLDGDTIVTEFNISGTVKEPIYDWGYGATTKLVIHQSPPFVQPTWPSGEGYGRIPQVKVNGTDIIGTNNWAPMQSAVANLINKRLEVTDDTSLFYVDCSGDTCIRNIVMQTSKPKIPDNSAQFSIFPNPTTDYFEVKCTQCNHLPLNHLNIEVYNVSGQLFYNRPFNQFTPIIIKNWPRGLYIVKFGGTHQKLIIN